VGWRLERRGEWCCWIVRLREGERATFGFPHLCPSLTPSIQLGFTHPIEVVFIELSILPLVEARLCPFH
jgi:hypothetical protein